MVTDHLTKDQETKKVEMVIDQTNQISKIEIIIEQDQTLDIE